MTTEQPLYIIDGHSMLFKAYYAIKRLSNSRGIPTNAIYGFVQMLNKLIRDQQPSYLAVVFDYPGPSFRKEIYEPYKANRPEAPEDFQLQLSWVKKILKAMNITTIEQEGYEADDIIGSLVELAQQQGFSTIVVSADKDLFQLVNERTLVLRSEYDKFVLYDSERAKEKMGVVPEKITDLIGLMGDSTDNIPGIPGIGPKTAAQLIKDFGSLEQLLSNTDNIAKEKLRHLLKEHAESALLSKNLATIRCDSPLEIKQIEALKWEEQKSPELMNIYQELEFQSLLREFPAMAKERNTSYHLVESLDELEELVKRCRGVKLLAVDTETTSSDPMQARLVGISLSYEADSAYYIPLGHNELIAQGKNLPLKPAIKCLKPLFEDEVVGKCGHNIKFDLEVLRRHGLCLKGIIFDTMVGSYLLNPEQRAHGLKEIAQEYLQLKMTPISELIGKGKKALTMDQVSIDRVKDYAAQDADATLQLTILLRERLSQNRLLELFNNIELPLIEVLSDMEMTGVCIEEHYFEQLSQEFAARLSAIADDIYQLVGQRFNLNSPRQVSDVLFNQLKLKPIKAGKTGYSTNVTVLEELSQHHPVASLLLEYRTYEKLKTTYIDTLPKLINPQTGRIHTSYNQSLAATGRLISSEPNLQNIPVRSPQGKQIRRGFIPSTANNFLVSADYSQIELRLLAHISGDPELSQAFKLDKDIHRITGTKIFACSEEEVTPKMRDQAKTVNFGIIYGMSAHGLSQQLKISREQAQQFINEYFQAYRGVKNWIEKTIELARKEGYVTTLLNRRRYLPDINSPNKTLRSNSERIAINTPIQGTAADLIKQAMINIQRRLKKAALQTKMILQIHDELIFDVPEQELAEAADLVKREMETALELDVPIKAEVKWGKNWAEC